MIKLLIVEDEETTRNSLFKSIPWNLLGISDVQTAENGVAALNAVQLYSPSILLTDISMPKMNGIELASQIRQLIPNCVIIFLTAMSDKNYLKSAIKLNAFDYVEKPIDIEEIIVLFQKVVQQLIEKQNARKELAQLKRDITDNIYLRRQELVLELIHHQSDFNSVKNRFGQEMLHLSTTGWFSVICILLRWETGVSQKCKILAKNKLLKILNTDDYLSDFQLIAGFTSEQHLIIIANDKMDNTTPRYKSFWDHLFKLLLQMSNNQFTFTAACGIPSKGLLSIEYTYKTALQILKNNFYLGANKVLFHSSLNNTSYHFDKENYALFKKLLRNDDKDPSIHFVINLTKEISSTHDPDIRKIKNIFFILLRALFEVKINWDVMEASNESENRYIWEELDEIQTLDELSKLLLSNLENSWKRSDFKQNTTVKIEDIKSYILTNYRDNNLTIQSIANSFFLSRTYLCACFKKATGATINEFITELRINVAKDYLTDRKIKLYEITTLIGFSDANYFSILFKKHVGITPSEYREKVINDQNNT